MRTFETNIRTKNFEDGAKSQKTGDSLKRHMEIYEIDALLEDMANYVTTRYYPIRSELGTTSM